MMDIMSSTIQIIGISIDMEMHHLAFHVTALRFIFFSLLSSAAIFYILRLLQGRFGKADALGFEM